MSYRAPESPARAGGRAGVLLANLGTPAAPTAAALRPYLRQFLGDRRVVEASPALWWVILNLVILPLRPRRSARLYRAIWTEDGSPLLTMSRRQAEGIARRLGPEVPVALGMRYGSPSIAEALAELDRAACGRILVLPLYPQYSATTTASTFDALFAELGRWRRVPEVQTVSSYAGDPGYLAALAASVQEDFDRNGLPERLLLSFHGIPRRYALAGDPYPRECSRTAVELAARLELPPGRWKMAFQSRFGREPWLKPYADRLLERWGGAGLDGVAVLCPGFAADCLETLEEMAVTNRELFHAAGGGAYRYVPALNDRPDHLDAIATLLDRRLSTWRRSR